MTRLTKRQARHQRRTSTQLPATTIADVARSPPHHDFPILTPRFANVGDHHTDSVKTVVLSQPAHRFYISAKRSCAMALWKEIEQFKSNPARARVLSKSLLATPGLTTWEEEERPAQ